MGEERLAALKAEVKRVVRELIEYESNCRIEKLERLYADTMRLIRIDAHGKISVLDKHQVLELVRSMPEAGSRPTDTEAEFNRVDVDGDLANVVVTRSMKLSGKPEKVVFTLSMGKRESSWLVLEETMVSIV